MKLALYHWSYAGKWQGCDVFALARTVREARAKAHKAVRVTFDTKTTPANFSALLKTRPRVYRSAWGFVAWWGD